MFIRAGSGIYNIDGRSFNVKKGDIMLFNANVLHDESPMASDDLLIFSCGVEQLKLDGLPLNVLTTRAQPAVMPSGEFHEEIGNCLIRCGHTSTANASTALKSAIIYSAY